MPSDAGGGSGTGGSGPFLTAYSQILPLGPPDNNEDVLLYDPYSSPTRRRARATLQLCLQHLQGAYPRAKPKSVLFFLSLPLPQSLPAVLGMRLIVRFHRASLR